jgi:hypothetical protein
MPEFLITFAKLPKQIKFVGKRGSQNFFSTTGVTGSNFQNMKPPGQRSIIPANLPLAKLVRVIFAAVIFFTAAISLSAADATNAYASWIKPWSERPVTSPALDAPLKLIVSNVRGELDEAAVTAMTPVQRLDLAYHIKVSATEVATNGGYRSYVVSNTDARTSDIRWLSPNGIWQLDGLISILPDDNSQLPPAGNRIVVQFRADGQWRIRVYDGNNLPPEAQAVLNLLAKPYRKLF